VLARRWSWSFSEPTDSGASSRRRRVTVAATMVIGTFLLTATLRVPPGSKSFFVIGLLAGGTWILGSLVSGPIPVEPIRSSRVNVVVQALALSIVAFLGFLAADLVGEHLPLISSALHNILTRADAGSIGLVLGVALVNGLGEELFFRGALFSALGSCRPVAGSTIFYVAVTAATGNVALVVAAGLMGFVFALQRQRTGSILAPVVTHLCWSALMLLALPR
jgi:membrane protease YdiL (CAAX protease family)